MSSGRDWSDIAERFSREIQRIVSTIVSTIPTVTTMVFSSVEGSARCHIVEEQDKIIVACEVPGASKESVRVVVRGDEVEVRAENQVKLRGLPERYYARVKLPEEVDPKQAKARFVNGIVIVELRRRGLEGYEVPIE